MAARVRIPLGVLFAGRASLGGLRRRSAAPLEAPASCSHRTFWTETTIEATSLAGLADALINARIARGWTQADLARKLGVAGQQVQRDEANRYSGSALSRLCDVAEALEIDVSETITLRAS